MVNKLKYTNTMQKFFKIILITSLSITYSCNSEKKVETKEAKKELIPVLTVTTLSPVKKDIKKTLSVTGNLSAWDMVYVQPAISGLKVIDIYGDTGQYVNKNQVLVKLDDSMIKAQINSAKSRLINAQSQLEKTKNPNRDQDVLRLKAALEQSKVNLMDAEQNYKRYQSLYEQGAVSKLDLDSKNTLLKTAEALYKQEEQRLNLTLAGSRTEDITIAQAAVADAQAQIQQLNIQLAQTIITSPDSGLIQEKQVFLGDVSSSMNKMFSIVRHKRFELQAKVPESDLKNIREGQFVNITSDADSKISTSGTIRQIGPGVDPVSRQAIVKISTDYVDGMQTGQFLRGSVNIGSNKSLVVPSKALINNEGISKIFIVNDKSFVNLKKVEIGSRTGDFIEVKSGLTERDKIIVDGIGFLRDGDFVKVVPTPKGGKA